jgi:hypothetical protein
MNRYQLVDEVRLYIATVLLGWVLTWLPDGHRARRHLMAACETLAE